MAQRKTGIKRAFILSLTFAFGLAVMFTIMGIMAALVGTLFGDVGTYWKYIVTAICIVVANLCTGTLHANIGRGDFGRCGSGDYAIERITTNEFLASKSRRCLDYRRWNLHLIT